MERFKTTFKKSAQDPVDKRQNRHNVLAKGRKDNRERRFAAQRSLGMAEENSIVENVDLGNAVNNENQRQGGHGGGELKTRNHMKQRLLKWKEEKERQRLKEQQQKAKAKPAFKVSTVVRHENNFMETPLKPVQPSVKNVATLEGKVFQGSGSQPFVFKAHRAPLFQNAPMSTRTRAAVPVPVVNPPKQKAQQVLSLLTQRGQQKNVPKSTVVKPGVLPNQGQTRTLRSRVVPLASTASYSKVTNRVEKKPAAPAAQHSSKHAAVPAADGPTLVSSSKVAKSGEGKEAAHQSSKRTAVPPAVEQQDAELKPSTSAPTAASQSNKVSSVKSAKKVATPAKGKDKSSSVTSPPVQSVKADTATPKRTAATPRHLAPSHQGKSTISPAKPVVHCVPKVDKEEVASTSTLALGSSKKTPKPLGEEHDSAYFRRELSKTIAALEQKCSAWELEKEQHEQAMTEVAHEHLLLATGMARLLIREKFAQFLGLIESCEAEDLENRTLPSDLQGFWDMLSIQVEDIHKKFQKLEDLKKNNWIPLAIVNPKRMQLKTTAAQPKPKVAPLKTRSNFKAFLAAKKQQVSEPKVCEIPDVNTLVMSMDIDSGSSGPRTPVSRVSVTRASVSTRDTSLLRSSLAAPRAAESPVRVNAIMSATRTAKSAGRKSSIGLDLLRNTGSASTTPVGVKSVAKTSTLVSASRPSLVDTVKEEMDQSELIPLVQTPVKPTSLAGASRRKSSTTNWEGPSHDKPSTSTSSTPSKRGRVSSRRSINPANTQEGAAAEPCTSTKRVTPLRSILKETPATTGGKKGVVFSAPTLIEDAAGEEGEEDVLSTPHVIRTYGHSSGSSVVSEFDKLLLNSPPPTLGLTLKSTSSEDDETNRADDDMNQRKSVKKPPTPYFHRKGRKSDRFSFADVDMESVESSQPLEQPADADLMMFNSPLKDRKSRRRSSRFVLPTVAAAAAPSTPSDLISWDSPAVGSPLRRSTRLSKLPFRPVE